MDGLKNGMNKMKQLATRLNNANMIQIIAIIISLIIIAGIIGYISNKFISIKWR